MTFTVDDLKAKLDTLPSDLLVIMSTDEEGNRFHELRVVERAHIRDDGYDFDVLHPDDADGDEDEAIVLWP